MRGKPRKPLAILKQDSGAAAVEFSLVSFALIMFCLGVVEFGRGLYTRNQLSQAADYGARKLLTTPQISDADVETALRASFNAGDASRLSVNLASETVDGAPYRVITITYPFTLLIPGLINNPISLSVARRTPVL